MKPSGVPAHSRSPSMRDNGIKGGRTMKRMIFLAAALLLAACSRETLPVPDEETVIPEAKTYTVSLKATFDPETRLSFDAGSGAGTWASDDQVAVFTEQGNLVVGSIQEGDFSPVSPVFTFEIATGDKIEEGATAYYPASIAVSGNPNQIVLPASYASADAMSRAIPMKATVSAGTMAFQHLASMVYVSPFTTTTTPSHPSGMGPENVEFSVSGTQPITGKFTVSGMSLSPADDNGTTVSAPWAINKPYYFCLPPATYDDGFSLSITSDVFRTQAGRDVHFVFYKKQRSSSFAAAQAHLLKMPAFDPQCKEFYLTSTETDWSDNVKTARMIQTGSNSYLGALYSHRGPLGDRDLGFRILQGFNLGTDWFNVIGGRNDNDSASFGENVGNIYGDVGVWKVSLTLHSDHWTYTTERVDNEYHHDQLYLVGDFTNWEHGRIALDQPVGHNWTKTVTFDTAVEGGWKIYNGSWDVQWNDGHIDADHLSSYVNYNNSYAPDGTLNLPAGTYNVFFNDATG